MRKVKEVKMLRYLKSRNIFIHLKLLLSCLNLKPDSDELKYNYFILLQTEILEVFVLQFLALSKAAFKVWALLIDF